MYATVDKNGHFTGVAYSEMTQSIQDWHDDAGFTWVVVEKNPDPIGEDDLGLKKYGKPTTEQILAEQIAEAKQYLESTDHKFLVGYVPKDGEDLDAILALRNEKRWFIRANE